MPISDFSFSSPNSKASSTHANYECRISCADGERKNDRGAALARAVTSGVVEFGQHGFCGAHFYAASWRGDCFEQDATLQ
jgi:hypothetical protein